MNPIRRRSAIIAAVAAAAAAVFAATALAKSSGGPQVSMTNTSSAAVITTMSTAWTDLNASRVSVTAPSEGLLINARFTAESACGKKAAICRVRIIAKDGTSLIELDPVVGKEFAFDESIGDTAADDLREAHAMERSARLPKGDWRIGVEYSVSSPSTLFKLDDWHFTVEASE